MRHSCFHGQPPEVYKAAFERVQAMYLGKNGPRMGIWKIVVATGLPDYQVRKFVAGLPRIEPVAKDVANTRAFRRNGKVRSAMKAIGPHQAFHLPLPPGKPSGNLFAEGPAACAPEDVLVDPRWSLDPSEERIFRELIRLPFCPKSHLTAYGKSLFTHMSRLRRKTGLMVFCRRTHGYAASPYQRALCLPSHLEARNAA
jgi:hypothetical protein